MQHFSLKNRKNQNFECKIQRLTEYIREQGSDPAEVDFDEFDVLAKIGEATSQAEEKEDPIEEQEQEKSEKAAAEDQTGEDASSTLPNARKNDEPKAEEEAEEAQVIHQTDEPLTAEQRAELTATIDMRIPMAGTVDNAQKHITHNSKNSCFEKKGWHVSDQSSVLFFQSER